jgi:hypothetical protein
MLECVWLGLSSLFSALLGYDLLLETCTYHNSLAERVLHAYVGHIPRGWVLGSYAAFALFLFVQGLASLMQVCGRRNFLWTSAAAAQCRNTHLSLYALVVQPRIIPFNANHMRVLPFSKISNFRDCGGYATIDKKFRVRWGRYARS